MYLERARECPQEWSALGGTPANEDGGPNPKALWDTNKAPAAAFRSSFPPPPAQGPRPQFHTSSPAHDTNTNIKRDSVASKQRLLAPSSAV